MHILVVGGYGSVGRRITRELKRARNDSTQIRVAGRNLTKAEGFASRFGDDVSGASFDLEDSGAYAEILHNIDTVIVCVDQRDTGFVEECLNRGIDYVDVTANDCFFKKIENFDELAVESGARAILNVGLMPGVSNLLAVDAMDSFSTVDSIELNALLGLQNEVGPEGLTWLLEGMAESFTIREGDANRRVESLSEPKTVIFPKFGRLRAYRFNFADQHALARTLHVPFVSSRACLHPGYVTDSIALLRRMGLYTPLLSFIGASNMASLIDYFPVGSDEFVIKASVTGIQNGEDRRVGRWIRGHNQSQATALATVAITGKILGGDRDSHEQNSPCPPGVHFTHEVVGPGSIFRELSEHGYRFGRSSETFPDGKDIPEGEPQIEDL